LMSSFLFFFSFLSFIYLLFSRLFLLMQTYMKRKIEQNEMVKIF